MIDSLCTLEINFLPLVISTPINNSRFFHGCSLPLVNVIIYYIWKLRRKKQWLLMHFFARHSLCSQWAVAIISLKPRGSHPIIYFEIKISNSCRITQVARCDFLKLLTLQAQNTAIGVTGRKLSDLLLQITKYKSLESKLIDIFFWPWIDVSL